MSRLSDTIDQAQSQIAARILSLTAANPLVSYKEVAKQVGCSEDFVRSVMKRAGFARRPGRKPKAVK